MVFYKHIVNGAMTDKLVMVFSIWAVSNSRFFGSLHQLLCVCSSWGYKLKLLVLDTGLVVRKIAATSLHKICLGSGISRDMRGGIF